MSNRTWAVVRLLVGAAILGALVWRLGTGPFLDGLRLVDAQALLAALSITFVTTVCCAWRWTLVARGLGVGLPLGSAVAAYYRSQFLNTTLPGGVLGDVHRGVRHGREARDLSAGLRAVAWERVAGQIVQVVLSMVVLLLVASPVRSSMPAVLIGCVVAAVGLVLLWRALPDGWLPARTGWPGIVLASAVAVSGHVAAFLVAARTAGATGSLVQLLPLAVLVLLAMGLPLNVAGWGPREGVAAWAFSAAGLGASLGVATAVVYGVMALVASLPGALLLTAPRRSTELREEVAVHG